MRTIYTGSALKGRHIRTRETPDWRAMPQSYTCCHYHIVFSTKGRARLIADPVRPQLHAYMAGIVNNFEGKAIRIGGTG
jgi:hypothetical protein